MSKILIHETIGGDKQTTLTFKKRGNSAKYKYNQFIYVLISIFNRIC